MDFLFFFAELFFQQADAFGQFFYRWELVLNFFDFYIVVGGNSHRGCDAFERILDVSVIFIAANQETDGRVLGWGFYEVIHGIDIEVEFSGKLRLEWYNLEFYNDITIQWYVEEE